MEMSPLGMKLQVSDWSGSPPGMIRRRDVLLPGWLLAAFPQGGIRTRRALPGALLGPPRGPMTGRELLGAKTLATVVDGQRAIEVGVDVHPRSSVAAPTGTGLELEEAAVELHGVIVLDGALVLEATDAVEIGASGSRPPGGLGVRGSLSETGIVAWEKAVEHALGLGERAGLGEAELADEAVLEGAKEPLDPPLGLRGACADPADAEFLEGAPDLGRRGSALELLGEGQWGAGIAVEDPVAVGVRRTGEAIAADELAEEQEVAVGILFQAEDAAEDPARRVVDGRVEHETWPAIFEPGVVAAIHLDEEAGLGHACPTATMAGGTAGAGAADALGAQQPLHGRTGEPEARALLEQFGEMVIVHAGIGGARQGKNSGPDGFREAPRRGTAAVPMGQASEALLAQAGQQPTEVAKREAQQHGGLRGR